MNLLSRYTLLERLGNNVLGTTYKAQDKATGSLVTLRLLYLGLLDDVSRQELEARLQRDFEAADRLQHPGIARVFEMRREGHTALIASELIDGPTVTSFARASGGSELSQVVTAVGQLLDALDFAHRQGVLHRDLRPANVRVQGERLKIADFGMADLGGSGDDAGHRDRTEYMAPEQFGSGGIDARCDIHASGVILYELLTGRSPFAGEADGLTAMFRVLNFVPLPPSQVRPGLAPAFDRVVQRALAKAPGERFATAQQFRDELRSAYSTLMRRPPPDTLVRSVFASQVPAAPAARTADSSLTSPLPEELFVDKARPAAPVAPARAAGDRAAATPARAAPAAADAPVSGNTMPGGKAAASGAATPREVTSRSQRPDTPAARASDAPKGNGHADGLKSIETAAPAPSSRDTEKGSRGAPGALAAQPENKKFVPERAPAMSAAPAAAAPAESARAKEPEKAAPPGGTVLTPPKRVAESPRPSVEPPPAKDARKDAPAAGGTVLAPPKRPAPASEPEKPKPVAGGTVLSPVRPAADSSVADDLIGDAVPVESVLADEPKPPEPAPPRAAAPAKPAAPSAPASEPAAEDELSETQQAKQFGRTVWIPTPKDDSGLYRPPKVEPPPAAPAESVASTPPPKAPPPAAKKVVPLTDAAVTHGGKVLARFMGPIAMVLSRRAAQDYKDEKAFFDALASHLSDPDERYKFLREVRQRPG